MFILFLFFVKIAFSKHILQFDNNNSRSFYFEINQNSSKNNRNYNMNQYIASVNLLQQQHDEILFQQLKECISEQKYRSYQIQDAKNILRKSQQILEKCQKDNHKFTNKMRILDSMYTISETFYEILNNITQKEQYYFNALSYEYLVANDQITQIVSLINQIFQGKTDYNQLSSILQNLLLTAIKINATFEFKIFLQFFPKLSQSINFDESLKKEFQILVGTLKNKIKERRNLIKIKYESFLNDFHMQTERIVYIIQNLQNLKEQKQKIITNSGQCIVFQAAIQNAAQLKLHKNQQFFDQMNQLCTILETNGELAQQARQEQISLVNQLQQSMGKFQSKQSDNKYFKKAMFQNVQTN